MFQIAESRGRSILIHKPSYVHVVLKGLNLIPSFAQEGARHGLYSALKHPNTFDILEKYSPPDDSTWIIEQARLFPVINYRWEQSLSISDRYIASLACSGYGEKLVESIEEPGNHHGVDHIYRLKNLIWLALTHSPELAKKYNFDKYSNRSSDIAIAVAAGFSPFHDINQVDSNSKIGHALGGAAMVLATKELYTKVAHLENDPQKAHDIIASLALAIAVHDIPEELENALAGEQNAQIIPDDQLYKKWKSTDKEERPDPFTLSPHQVLVLLKAEKGEIESEDIPFITNEKPFGLSKEFETTFASELKRLDNDHTPLLAHLSQEAKEAVKYAIRIAVLADQTDMIIPEESFLRKLAVPVARNIPLWTSKSIDSARERIFGRKGNIEKTDFNLGRALWEIENIDKLIQNSELGESKFLRRFIGVTQLLATTYTKEIGTVFMKGHEKDIRELLINIGDKQKKALHEKHARKRHDGRRQKSNERLEIVVNTIDKLSITVLTLLHEKPGGLVKYLSEKIDDFHTICNEEIERASERSGLTRNEVDKITLEGNYPLPYTTYYSLKIHGEKEFPLHPRRSQNGNVAQVYSL